MCPVPSSYGQAAQGCSWYGKDSSGWGCHSNAPSKLVPRASAPLIPTIYTTGSIIFDACAWYSPLATLLGSHNLNPFSWDSHVCLLWWFQFVWALTTPSFGLCTQSSSSPLTSEQWSSWLSILPPASNLSQEGGRTLLEADSGHLFRRRALTPQQLQVTICSSDGRFRSHPKLSVSIMTTLELSESCWTLFESCWTLRSVSLYLCHNTEEIEKLDQ